MFGCVRLFYQDLLNVLLNSEQRKIWKSSHATPHNSCYRSCCGTEREGNKHSHTVYELSNWCRPLLDSVGNGLPYQDHIFAHRFCVFFSSAIGSFSKFYSNQQSVWSVWYFLRSNGNSGGATSPFLLWVCTLIKVCSRSFIIRMKHLRAKLSIGTHVILMQPTLFGVLVSVVRGFIQNRESTFSLKVLSKCLL